MKPPYSAATPSALGHGFMSAAKTYQRRRLQKMTRTGTAVMLAASLQATYTATVRHTNGTTTKWYSVTAATRASGTRGTIPHVLAYRLMTCQVNDLT